MAAGTYYRRHAHDDRRQSLASASTPSSGAPITITVLRDGKKLDVTIKPKRIVPRQEHHGRGQMRACCNLALKHGEPRYLLGILPSEVPDVLDVGVLASAKGALEYPIDQTR